MSRKLVDNRDEVRIERPTDRSRSTPQRGTIWILYRVVIEAPVEAFQLNREAETAFGEETQDFIYSRFLAKADAKMFFQIWVFSQPRPFSFLFSRGSFTGYAFLNEGTFAE